MSSIGIGVGTVVVVKGKGTVAMPTWPVSVGRVNAMPVPSGSQRARPPRVGNAKRPSSTSPSSVATRSDRLPGRMSVK